MIDRLAKLTQHAQGAVALAAVALAAVALAATTVQQDVRNSCRNKKQLSTVCIIKGISERSMNRQVADQLARAKQPRVKTRKSITTSTMPWQRLQLMYGTRVLASDSGPSEGPAGSPKCWGDGDCQPRCVGTLAALKILHIDLNIDSTGGLRACSSWRCKTPYIIATHNPAKAPAAAWGHPHCFMLQRQQTCRSNVGC